MKAIKLSSTSVLVLAWATSFAAAGELELDLEVGRTADGRLAVAPYDFGTVILQPVDPGNPFGLHGFIGDNPGWAAEGAPEGLLPLEAGAEVRAELQSLSPALRTLDPNAGLTDVLPGMTWLLGGPEFDAHPVWLIDSSHPAFDPNQPQWIASFRLIDTGSTGYTPSESHSIAFGIPEPGALALLLAGALFAARRRGCQALD